MISIGFDVGGTNTKVCVMEEKYKVLKEFMIETPNRNGYDCFIKEISGLIVSLKKEFSRFTISGLCLAIAGDVDSVNGVLRYAPNLNQWRNKNIKHDLEKISNIKCFIENDANMAAWGCYVFDTQKKFNDMVVFTLGTGVGGGIIIGGKLYRGSTSTAGELGHMIINSGGRKCGCGNYGCLEAYCGTAPLIYDAKKRIRDVEDFIKKYSFDGDEITPELISKAAQKKDDIALRLWSDYGYNLGTGVGNILMLLNPECVCFCGGISRASKFFMPSVKKRIDEYGIKTPGRNIKIIVSKHHNIGVAGAAAFVFEK